MASTPQVSFDQFKIFIGDGATPEVFTPRCLLNAERGLSINPEYNDVVVPDCDDPTLPSIIRKYVTQVSAEITGSGSVGEADVEYFLNWALVGEPRNIKAQIGNLEVSFASRLGPFSPSASRDDVVNADISLMSDGAVTLGTV